MLQQHLDCTRDMFSLILVVEDFALFFPKAIEAWQTFVLQLFVLLDNYDHVLDRCNIEPKYENSKL